MTVLNQAQAGRLGHPKKALRIGELANPCYDTCMNWIEHYQTLIVGVLGFAGVVYTLRSNAQRARDQRKDELRHERQSLRAALIEELKINRDAAAGNMKTLTENPERKGAFVPTDRMDDAYMAFMHRIGTLTQLEVSKVMGAYLLLRTYNAKLFLLGVPPDTSDRHVEIPVERVEALALLQGTLIGPIDEAIEAMEGARDTD
jgi:hypothetical protein